MEVVFYALAIIFAFAGMGLCAAGGARSRRMRVKAVAVVEGVREGFLILALSVNGEVFRRDAMCGKKVSGFEEGDGVDVRYDEASPREFVHESELRNDTVIAAVFGFLGCVFAFAGYICQIV